MSYKAASRPSTALYLDVARRWGVRGLAGTGSFRVAGGGVWIREKAEKPSEGRRA